MSTEETNDAAVVDVGGIGGGALDESGPSTSNQQFVNLRAATTEVVDCDDALPSSFKDYGENKTNKKDDTPNSKKSNDFIDSAASVAVQTLECPICLQTCIHPARLPCGHIFCFLCIKGVAYKNRRCAMCRREISLEFLEQPQLVTAIDATLLPKDGYQWFYEGRNGWWQYDDRTSQDIEEAFKKRKKTCTILVAGYVYIVDFETMVQQRQNEPSRSRRVKRDLATIPKKGVAGLRIGDNSTASGNSNNGSNNGSSDGNSNNGSDSIGSSVGLSNNNVSVTTMTSILPSIALNSTWTSGDYIDNLNIAHTDTHGGLMGNYIDSNNSQIDDITRCRRYNAMPTDYARSSTDTASGSVNVNDFIDLSSSSSSSSSPTTTTTAAAAIRTHSNEELLPIIDLASDDGKTTNSPSLLSSSTLVSSPIIISNEASTINTTVAASPYDANESLPNNSADLIEQTLHDLREFTITPINNMDFNFRRSGGGRSAVDCGTIEINDDNKREEKELTPRKPLL